MGNPVSGPPGIPPQPTGVITVNNFDKVVVDPDLFQEGFSQLNIQMNRMLLEIRALQKQVQEIKINANANDLPKERQPEEPDAEMTENS